MGNSPLTLPVDPNVATSGTGGDQAYRITLDADGLFTVHATGTSLSTLLSLRDAGGHVLIQAETSPSNPDDRIAIHLKAGSYQLDLSSLAGPGSFALSTTFTPASAPGAQLAEGRGAPGLASADLNGDGKPDLILPDEYDNQILVNLGVGDGTFQPPRAIPVGVNPVDAIAFDANHDGRIDLAVVDQSSNDLTILLGDGLGGFRASEVIPTLPGPVQVVAGSFFRAGSVDLAVAIPGSDAIQVFHQGVDGRFSEASRVQGIVKPSSIALTDLNGDGLADLVASSSSNGTLTLLEGQGGGRFVALPNPLVVGIGCSEVISVDLDGDVRPEIAAVNPLDGRVTLFRFDGLNYRQAGRLQAGVDPRSLVAGDFDGDGRIDLATANYGSNDLSVFFGRENHTFRFATSPTTGSGPISLVATDLDGDGRPDLLTSDFLGQTVSVLNNNGDGTFRSPTIPASVANPKDVTSADVNGDGLLDLVTLDTVRGEVSVLLGRGDGSFRSPIRVDAGLKPIKLVVGDLSGDGKPDIAAIDEATSTILVLQGLGDGRFHPIQTISDDHTPSFLKLADLDGDRLPDLIVADKNDNDIDIYRGVGRGQFARGQTIIVGEGPSGIAVGDFNGDGRPDIAVSNAGSGDISLLLATGPRDYEAAPRLATGSQPRAVVSADFNGDGRLDLIFANDLFSRHAISISLGVGDGTFRPPIGYGDPGSPDQVLVGDFNGDGRPDVLTGNIVSNDLDLLPGRGDGGFAANLPIQEGINPEGLAVGDFNGDGRLDIVCSDPDSTDLAFLPGEGRGTFAPAVDIPYRSGRMPTLLADLAGNGVLRVLVADPDRGTISVNLSQGDGTFVLESTIPVGGRPSGLALEDLNGDGRTDLAVTDEQNDQVIIFLGLGDGTFQRSASYPVGKSPRSPIIVDLNDDGRPDLAVVDTDSDALSVLLGRGNGTFLPDRRTAVGSEPISVSHGPPKADGTFNLAVLNGGSHDLTELIGLPGGGFVARPVHVPGFRPTNIQSGNFVAPSQDDLVIADESAGRIYLIPNVNSSTNRLYVVFNPGLGRLFVATADLEHRGKSDLIVANAETRTVTILRDWSGTAFRFQASFRVDVTIGGLTVADLNHDGLLDILITQDGTGELFPYLSSGRGVFLTPESSVPLPHPNPVILPHAAGVNDISTINGGGNVTRRIGRPGAVAEFDTPVNLIKSSDITIRDLVVARTATSTVAAALDARRPLIYIEPTDDTPLTRLSFLRLPDVGDYSKIIAGDLFGTGRDDLVVLDRSKDQLIVFRQVADGRFSILPDRIPVGFGPTDVILARLVPGGLPELVVTNGSSGDLSVIRRGVGGSFLPEVRLAAGLAPTSTLLLNDVTKRTSPDLPVGLASGVFGPSGFADVAVIDRGTNRLTILKGLGNGLLDGPQPSETYATGLAPVQVQAARLRPGGLLDLVVLNEGSRDLSIYLNDGRGGFRVLDRIDAGNHPSAFQIQDVTGDGFADLVVGNAGGDILILAGNGDGTFQPYQRADGTVNLAVGDLTGNGQNDFVLSNTSKDLLTVQTGSPSTGFLQDRGDGLLAPGPVAINDMNGDGIPDLIVTSTGSNDVFVYLGLGQGRFAAPQRYFTGTAPSGLTVADLTGDGLPDLVVANSGSNDVTLLIGSKAPDGSWSMKPGPRLKVGNHPIFTAVADVFDDGNPDLLVVNQQDNTVSLLRGLGGGFFDDKSPVTLATGLGPVQVFVGRFSSSTGREIVVLDARADNMTIYDGLDAAPRFLPTGGSNPVAGVMGDFNNDGFSDLAIANNGDSKITLFYGGTNGLSLAQTILLGTSARPTGLVVTGSKGGNLQFFVGAEGQDHAIAVVFAPPAVVITFVVTPVGGDPVNSGDVVRSSGGGLAPTGSGGLVVLAASEGINLARGASAVSSAVSASTGLGALSQSSAVVSSMTQATQPLFLPSGRSLIGLIDDLVEPDQGRTAEILPLGKNEMAAVAVLLSASRLAAEPDEGETPAAESITDDDRPFVVRPSAEARSVEPSPLDRFTANLDVEPGSLPRNLLVQAGRRIPFGPDWAWRQHADSPNARTASFNAPTDATPGAEPEAASVLADLNGPGEVVAEIPGPSTWMGWAAWGGATVATTLVGLGWWFARRQSANLPPSLPKERSNRKVGSSTPSKTLGSRYRSSPDLPPWLLGPVHLRRTRADDRTLVKSFFRKRS